MDRTSSSCDASSKASAETAGLEKRTCPLVFMSASGCRASENLNISNENEFFPPYKADNFCDAEQVPIF